MDDDFEKQVKEKFNITCKRCGSENVSISFDSGSDGWAGFSAGYIFITCESCQQRAEDH